ncbi:geranylgeranyl reductase [Halodesulfurarchaeum formicicum]|uniref:Geranylgeranyl reductase n=1 Tax=Halodesulfurarchaeum formicicum TaxID=1873524 RepID=A0A1D8S5Z1_9EURY|nr:geranylgeranyl reductase family protein [Halodesulfurarchaeum formicicum]AOW80762.1 geranylgeranyl reductase [Halodesulfurarchaeum formicicum]
MIDVAVVGLGPAGAHYARRAAQQGQSVVAFERGSVGEPLACSGHVSRDLWEFLPDAAPDRLRQHEIRGARFHVAPEDDGYLFYRDEPISNAIDRVDLDRLLVELAAEAGAEIRTNHLVTAVEEGPESVSLTVRGPDGVERVEAAMVVGADGPQSTVRRELGLPEPERFLVGTLRHVPEPDHADHVDVYLTVPGFFAWRIPRGDAGVEYGLAGPSGYDVVDHLDNRLAGHGVPDGERFGGQIPIGPPERVHTDRAILLGDAAGQTKPFTGGGILYGLRAAEIAARKLDPSALDTTAYERAWRAELGTEIRLGRWLRRAYSLPDPLARLGLSTLAGEIDVHMDEPSSLFSKDALTTLFRG